MQWDQSRFHNLCCLRVRTLNPKQNGALNASWEPSSVLPYICTKTSKGDQGRTWKQKLSYIQLFWFQLHQCKRHNDFSEASGNKLSKTALRLNQENCVILPFHIFAGLLLESAWDKNVSLEIYVIGLQKTPFFKLFLDN